MAKLTLQEQLLKAGLVSDAKAKTVKTEKRKQEKQQRKNNAEVVDEAKVLAEHAKLEQIEKDRLLNLQKAQEAEKKAIVSQIKQLIDEHKQAQDPDGLAYNFTDGSIVKKLYVNETMRDSLIRGRSAIVKFEKSYEVVNAEAAEKIRLRDSAYILVWNKAVLNEVVADDPYAAYQIPDDLMW
jgi:uncharacterized protein YaiL (DUF2058 family)